MSFKEVEISKIEKVQKKYEQEARELYSNTEEYKKYRIKTAKYSKDYWEKTSD